MKNNKKVILMILDGFGIGQEDETNGIFKANTPCLDELFDKMPNTSLGASGEDVGLPKGQMGNSEVGHLNIGSGRIIYQELSRIGKEIETEKFYENEVLLKGIENTVDKDGKLHIMGLLSDGGVHSHIDHIKALIDMGVRNNIRKICIHAFLDGRDVPPTSGIKYLQEIENYIEQFDNVKIASLSGRYYAMDRDNRWERVEKAYNMMIGKTQKIDENAIEHLRTAYENNETDEFVVPVLIDEDGKVEKGDTIVMANFRPDRAREITRAFKEDNFDGFKREKIEPLEFLTMTQYDKNFDFVKVLYPPEDIVNTLGEVISSNGISQLRLAETEKYAHVTFFFNGGKEEKYNLEERILIPSPDVATYDLKPEMSLFEVTDAILQNMEKYNFIVVNLANPDMVGHTGNMEATIKAIEYIDEAISKIKDKSLEIGADLFITADHGNADKMIDENKNPITAHSTNRVPFIYVGKERLKLKKDGILADIGATVLDIFDIEKPKEMTGKTLIVK